MGVADIVRITNLLYDAVAAVCPVEGLSIGRMGEPATVRFSPLAEATSDQMKAAQQVIDTFDWDLPLDPRTPQEKELHALQERVAAIELALRSKP